MKIILVCFLIGVTVSVMAQKNTMFLELGGNGGFASLNYERQLTNSLGISIRVGIGATFFEFEKDEPDLELGQGCAICGVTVPAPRVSATIPVSAQYLFDLRNDNYLETGLGSTWQLSEEPLFVHHASLGFRRYFGNGNKWMWKVTLTPILGVNGENAFQDSEPAIWGGVSIGKRF